MNYWHMQMHPRDQSRGTDEVYAMLRQQNIIGMAIWEEGKSQQAQFESDMQIGDIVLIRNGKTALALVKVTGDYFEENDDWLRRRRKIEILDDNPREDFPGAAVGTLERAAKKITDTYQYIDGWYQSLTNPVMNTPDSVQTIIALLKSKHQVILQGAPGTGKTRLAQEIAYRIIKGRPLSTDTEERQAQLIEMEEEAEKNKNYQFIQFHPAYRYEDFVRGMVATSVNGSMEYRVQNKVLAEIAHEAYMRLQHPGHKFVLVIDEINRANLPAVLGELIYALEYRGRPVESLYEKDDQKGNSRRIILPPNLFIIGTMNTADRSVGQVDYAIRRRFAFVDVKPDKTIIPSGVATDLFNRVEALFSNHLSPKFDQDDLLPGHSYFLGDDLDQALQYEIKPILHEYAKDGVLIDKGKAKIRHEIENLVVGDQ